MLGHFFQCDPDLRLTGTDVYLDPAEPRPVGIISHGHADHIGRHAQFIATASTASFLRLREGADLRGVELPFRQPHRHGDLSIELYPAGHILGSSMIRVTRGGASLLYTGDFRLRPSLTAEPAEVARADAVIMESTYGSPEWRFPGRDELRDRLERLVREILGRGRVPVLLAYSLGKAQEALAMIGEEFDLVLHPTVARITEIYRKYGVALPRYEVWSRQASFGRRTTTELRRKVVIVPPHLSSELRRIGSRETISLTGWALHSWRKTEGDHGLPLSDHGDFEELIELAGRVAPEVIYVTHGSRRFARELRERGHRAEFLLRTSQMRLF